ncbi:MAG: hypothetical protein OXC80_13725 [Gammaproteobacteria bacterium]|nr:hypothetical protein [Gammaproteobacteria bacterium]
MSGVLEADETYFRDSFNGSRGRKRGNPPVDREPGERARVKSVDYPMNTSQ